MDLEPGGAHGNAECFGLIRAGNGAAIVVGENHHRQAVQAGAKHPFTADKEVVAIHQGVHDAFSGRELFDAAGDHAPDLQRLAVFRHDVGKSWIRRLELDATQMLVQLLDGEITVHHGDDDVVVAWFDGPVHHQDVVVKDAKPNHGQSAGPQKISGLCMHHQQLGQVDLLRPEVFCRGWKASAHPVSDHCGP